MASNHMDDINAITTAENTPAPNSTAVQPDEGAADTATDQIANVVNVQSIIITCVTHYRMDIIISTKKSST